MKRGSWIGTAEHYMVGNFVLFWIDSERFPLFRGRKCSFWGIPRFTEESILRNGTESRAKKLFYITASKVIFSHTICEIFGCRVLWTKMKVSCSRKQNCEHVFVREMLRNKIPKVCFYSIFDPPNGIPNCFLFHGMVRKGISRVFCSSEQPKFRWNKPFVSSIQSFTE